MISFKTSLRIFLSLSDFRLFLCFSPFLFPLLSIDSLLSVFVSCLCLLLFLPASVSFYLYLFLFVSSSLCLSLYLSVFDENTKDKGRKTGRQGD